MHFICRFFVIGALLTTLVGCIASYGSVKQDALPIGQVVPEGYGVVLVAVTGPYSVDYIQLCHSKVGGCQNYRFPPLADDVIALPVALPKSQLELNSYTLAGRASGYAPFGGGAFVQYGFLGLEDKPFDLAARTVHFHLQIDTSGEGRFSHAPTSALIKRAADKYGAALTSIPPANFLWELQ